MLKANSTSQEKCEFVLKFSKSILKVWKAELAPLFADMETQSPEDKQKIGVFIQCGRYLNPLFKLLEKAVF